MAQTKIKTYSLAEMKDRYIGKVGSTVRDEYEYELSMEVMGRMIKTSLKFQNLKVAQTVRQWTLF